MQTNIFYVMKCKCSPVVVKHQMRKKVILFTKCQQNLKILLFCTFCLRPVCSVKQPPCCFLKLSLTTGGDFQISSVCIDVHSRNRSK